MLKDLISRGKVNRPRMQMIYGVPGSGKTTLAAAYPDPVFSLTEEGTDDMDVARLPVCKTYQDLAQQVGMLIKEDHSFKTYVLDSADWAEPLIWQHVCETAGEASIESFGYGKGYMHAAEIWKHLLGGLAKLRDTKNMNIVLIAHSKVKTINPPDAHPYDRYEPRMHEKAWSLCVEACSEVVMVMNELKVAKAEKEAKGKVRSAARVILTSPDSGFAVAKNRLGLPEKIPYNLDNIQEIVSTLCPVKG